MTTDIEGFRFNRAIARLYELTNNIAKADNDTHPAALREGIEALVLMIGPIMPHLAEQAWQDLGHTALVAESAWPKAEPDLLQEDNVTIAVQVNGKLRGKIELPRDSAEDAVQIAARDIPNVAATIGDRALRRAIVVPNKLVNFVV